MKNDSIPLGRALVSDVQGAVGLWISAVTHITEAQTALHTMVPVRIGFSGYDQWIAFDLLPTAPGETFNRE